MGVSPKVVAWLRAAGHDAVHLRDEQLHRLPNGKIFAKAASEGRCVLTFDLDFGEIVALSENHRTGVVVFRLRNTRTDFVIRRLGIVLATSGDALVGGAIVVVEDARHRVRRFPPA
jgi:predicted nuclease of predicted toxin-antitoxin system